MYGLIKDICTDNKKDLTPSEIEILDDIMSICFKFEFAKDSGHLLIGLIKSYETHESRLTNIAFNPTFFKALLV